MEMGLPRALRALFPVDLPLHWRNNARSARRRGDPSSYIGRFMSGVEEESMALPFARYGRAELAVATGGLLLFSGVLAFTWPWAALVPLPLIAFFFHFFRDPARRVPSEAGLIVAPADGRVTDIGVAEDAPFIEGASLRIGIFLSVFDVHVNRAPVDGRVAFRDYRRGRFLSALRYDACSRENECSSVGLDTGAVPGRRVLVRQIAGALAQRIVTDCRLGQRLERGERFGMIKFGSRTEIYLAGPDSLEVRVKVGDHVKGGETVLAVVRPGAGMGR
jgi:phosphatidylserine decarboxylase